MSGIFIRAVVVCSRCGGFGGFLVVGCFQKKAESLQCGPLPPRPASRQGPPAAKDRAVRLFRRPPHSGQPSHHRLWFWPPPLPSPLSPTAPSLTATALTQPPPADMSRLTGEGGGRGSSGIPPPKTESAVQARKSFYCSSLSLSFFYPPAAQG